MKDKIYVVELLGDLPYHREQEGHRDHINIFHSFEDALAWLRDNIGYPDPEDDRMLIWEVLPSEHKKVVWHFSGWHWDADEFGIPQGKYPSDEESVYAMCMKDIWM